MTTSVETADVARTLAGRALFVVWGPPSYGPRSRAFARELEIDVHFVTSFSRRGLVTAPLRYAIQAVRTLWLLQRHRPDVVFVQSPPSLAVLCVHLYAVVSGAAYVVDAHSGAFDLPYWRRPRWLHRRLLGHAVTTVVTNGHMADVVHDDGGRSMVVRDVPTGFPIGARPALPDAFNVAVVSSFAPDEPLEAIVSAAADTPDVVYHVTGPNHRAPGRVPSPLPPNVHLTGFLPDEDYYGLLSSVDAVMCLTTRDHTMQRGACEALSLGTPLITSQWDVLTEYFELGTVHVDATTEDILRGIREMRTEHARHRKGMQELRDQRQEEWRRARDGLVEQLSPLIASRAAVATQEG